MFSSWFVKHVIPTAEETAELKRTCEAVSLVLREEGFTTPAFSLEPRPFTNDFRQRLEHLKIFSELIAGPGRKNHKDLLWRYFGRMKFTPTSDFLDRLDDDDIVEIYDMNHEQIFRNLNYFEIVSFSVEDLVSINWKRDFKRQAKVTLQLIEMVFRFATGMFSKTFDCDKIPVHTVEEKIGKHHRIELALKFIAPLKQNGKCAALMAVSRARIIAKGS